MGQIKDLAKDVRKTLKKSFPDTKFSVTSKYNKISVSVMESDIDFGTDYQQVNHFYIDEKYEGDAKYMLKAVYDLVDKDNYTVVNDGDYGAVPSYYIDISIGKWDKPYKLKK